jgi:hypothetical protein
MYAEIIILALRCRYHLNDAHVLCSQVESCEKDTSYHRISPNRKLIFQLFQIYDVRIILNFIAASIDNHSGLSDYIGDYIYRWSLIPNFR